MHEKAVLLVLIPLRCDSVLMLFIVIDSSPFSLLAAERQAYFRTFIIATVAGVYSLFPLIFTPFGSSFL